MWLRLTSRPGNAIVADLSKVTDMHQVAGDTKPFFTSSGEDKEHHNISRSLVVTEDIEQIARALRAKRV